MSFHCYAKVPLVVQKKFLLVKTILSIGGGFTGQRGIFTAARRGTSPPREIDTREVLLLTWAAVDPAFLVQAVAKNLTILYCKFSLERRHLRVFVVCPVSDFSVLGYS